MNDYSKIWQEEDAVNDNHLLHYLKGELQPEAEHSLENQLINSSFESDAVDGLREIPAQQIQRSVADLDAQLRKMLPAKKKLKRKQAYTIQQWIILAIIIVLVIALSAYGLLYLVRH